MRPRRVIAGVGAFAALAALAGAWVAVGSDGSVVAQEEATVGNTAEAVQTDLVAETSYDATLGRDDGNAIRSVIEGTVTQVPEAGTTLDNGAVLYAVDGEPVVGLVGDTPAYRALTAYAEPADLGAPAEGVITWLPEEGAEIAAGSVVMRINGEPVIAIEGSVPAYRDLTDRGEDMTGEDVAQLERNIEAIGLADDYDVEVDDEFTSQTANALEAFQAWIGADDDGALNLGEFVVIDGPTSVVDVAAEVGDSVAPGGEPVLLLADGERLAGPDVAQLNTALASLGYTPSEGDQFGPETEAAVREYQTSVGMEPDGSFELGEVVFLPSAVRVSAVDAPVGTVLNPGGQVLTVTGEDIVVSFGLPAEEQGTLVAGDPVTVELPDGTEAPGAITSVATVASIADNAAVFPVEISLDDPSAAGQLDEAPVDVRHVSDSVTGVIAVPVAALVVLREGGYAVEVVGDDGTTHLVGVEAGFFADGLVEVTGDVAAGDLVVVP